MMRKPHYRYVWARYPKMIRVFRWGEYPEGTYIGAWVQETLTEIHGHLHLKHEQIVQITNG